jgi:hypothetical protein
MPVSRKAWLNGKLQEMERIRSEGEVAFLEYVGDDKTKWNLRVVEKPETQALARIRRWFSGTR